MTTRSADADDRIKSLDGVRGLAILVVLLNHFFPNRNYAGQHVMAWLNNFAMSGWAGVDLFFVLSGFLITGILLDTKGRPGYFRNFYMRRTLRIFPLYFGALALVFLLLPALGQLTPSDLGRVWDMQGWNWTYCTNVGMLLDDGGGFYCSYVNFGHFWSLAVEEHFYLAWPLLVYLTPRRHVWKLCLGLAAFAIAFRVVAVVAFNPPGVFFKLTPCRVDSLALGGLLATVHRSGRLPELVPAARVVGVVLSFVLLFAFFHWRCLPAHHWITYTFGYTVLAVLSATGIALAVSLRPGGRSAAVVGNAPLRFFGKYSYGLYVIHGMLAPLLVEHTPVESWIGALGSETAGAIACTLVRVAVCVALAMASWHLYEKRFLNLKRYFEYCKPASADELTGMLERPAGTGTTTQLPTAPQPMPVVVSGEELK